MNAAVSVFSKLCILFAGQLYIFSVHRKGFWCIRYKQGVFASINGWIIVEPPHLLIHCRGFDSPRESRCHNVANSTGNVFCSVSGIRKSAGNNVSISIHLFGQGLPSDGVFFQNALYHLVYTRKLAVRFYKSSSLRFVQRTCNSGNNGRDQRANVVSHCSGNAGSNGSAQTFIRVVACKIIDSIHYALKHGGFRQGVKNSGCYLQIVPKGHTFLCVVASGDCFINRRTHQKRNGHRAKERNGDRYVANVECVFQIALSFQLLSFFVILRASGTKQTLSCKVHTKTGQQCTGNIRRQIIDDRCHHFGVFGICCSYNVRYGMGKQTNGAVLYSTNTHVCVRTFKREVGVYEERDNFAKRIVCVLAKS